MESENEQFRPISNRSVVLQIAIFKQINEIQILSFQIIFKHPLRLGLSHQSSKYVQIVANFIHGSSMDFRGVKGGDVLKF